MKYSFIVISAFYFLSCSITNNSEINIVAEVNNNKLYASDLSKIIPKDLKKLDSSIIADDYIEKWVKQELLIQKANENLTPDQKDVTNELIEYRNSLIIYKYKNELIKQRMDTLVTEIQIEEYYSSHPTNFNLNKNIVKAIFVKIPNEVANPVLLKSFAANTSQEGLTDLKEYCVQYAKKFDIFIDSWVDFEIVKNNIPQEIENAENFLTNNNLIELNDSSYYYFVSIQDYKLVNDIAPLQFVKNNIKKLILNQRKIMFLKNVEDNIYKEGIRKNKFKIYDRYSNEK